MNDIVYYVAVSLDGFISGPNEDISGFVQGGNGVEQYKRDLAEYRTVIMGRSTYEFGYSYGLVPGQPAYPHMRHYVFSSSLVFDDPHPLVSIERPTVGAIERIREESETDVYLCGGGVFAGWMLENGKIDILKLKVNPVILGDGVRLFGNSRYGASLKLLDSKPYDHGLRFVTYRVQSSA